MRRHLVHCRVDGRDNGQLAWRAREGDWLINDDFLAIDDLVQVQVATDYSIIIVQAAVSITDLVVEALAIPENTVVIRVADVVNVELKSININQVIN